MIFAFKIFKHILTSLISYSAARMYEKEVVKAKL